MRNDHGHGHGGGGHHAPAQSNPDLLAQMGYETRDIALNTLVRWLFFLFVFIGAMTGTAFLTYKVFVPEGAEQERVAPLARLKKVPPYPQLQADPRRDMMEYRVAEDAAAQGQASAAAGEKVGLPIGEAMNRMATQVGIAGLKGDQAAPESNAYPGSGDYTTGSARAENSGTGDMTSYSATNGLTDAAPQAGGTGQGRRTVPGNDRTGVSAPVSGLNTQPGAPVSGSGPGGNTSAAGETPGTPPQQGNSTGATIPAQPAPVKPEGGAGTLPYR